MRQPHSQSQRSFYAAQSQQSSFGLRQFHYEASVFKLIFMRVRIRVYVRVWSSSYQRACL